SLYFFNDDETNELLRLSIESSAIKNSFDFEKIEEKIDQMIKNDIITIQNFQQPRIDKKLHNLRIELKDTEGYLKKQIEDLSEEIEKIERNIRETVDNEKGKKLINEKKSKQTRLANIEEELLIFKKTFDKKFRDEENKLLEKRFLEVEKEIIFSYEFVIV
ncbi:MAG TPA: hypothetical protein PK771_10685, partial [Spirochaetota bacterium]|nr:hypothetical protein [Spirochaetota bacterium]